MRHAMPWICLPFSALPAQNLAWESLAPAAAPTVRTETAVAYDTSRDRVVLFGGESSATGPALDDTWEWDGGTWLLRTPQHRPPARHGHALAYDPLRRRVVLFGGVISDPLHQYRDDTWEWDGTDWTELRPGSAPAPRRMAAMCWDGVRQALLLFGGKTGSGAWSDETWTWDGSHWTQLQTGLRPPARDGHTLVWDSHRARGVLFGGWVINGYVNDTWEWDGSAWQRVLPASAPPARGHHAMGFDVLRGRSVVFGANDTRNDTWDWDGTTWRELAATAPATSLGFPVLAFDEARGRSVLFAAATGATWQLWQPATEFGQGCGTRLRATGLARIGQPLNLCLDGAASAPAVLFLGSSYRNWLGVPLPLDLTGAGLPGCTVRIAMDALVGASFTSTAGTAQFGCQVPADPSLINQAWWLQGAAFPDFNLANLQLSNGLQIVIR